MKISEKMFDLTGKKAVVVGGAGGIGQAIAQALTVFGADVAISSRNIDNLNRAREEIQIETGKSVLIIEADASNEDSVKKLLQIVVTSLGNVDILVNAQGFNKKAPATEFPVELWEKMFDVNVKSMMLTCKHFGKYMKEHGKGKIINLSSVRGIRACGGGNSGYCATKGAVDMLTRVLAKELGPEVCVNAIGPTMTYTPMMVGILSDDPKERNKWAEKMPLQRIGNPEDCAGPAVFLASEASDFVSGQIIYPDGGLTAMG